MNDVKISIYDSIVQVLPNATKAVQNFNGDQFADKILSKKEAAEDRSSDADSPEARKLALYIGGCVKTLLFLKNHKALTFTSQGFAMSKSCCNFRP